MLLAAALYVSAVIFLAGMGWRWRNWLRTPVPLKIVLTPAPRTVRGTARRLVEETFGFRSLFRADRRFWVAAWLFHFSLLLQLVGHLARLVMPEFTRARLGLDEEQFHRLAQIGGGAFGILAVGSLLGLLIRRIMEERTRRISTVSDYFAVALLLAVIATGNHMRFVSGLDLAQARRFASGWLAFHPVAPPAGPVFAAHVMLVCALLIYIPFSKLVHLGGATLLSPTLNQRNDPRERRHINPWDPLPSAARANRHEGTTA